MKNQNIIVLTEYTNGNTSTVITFTKNLNLEFIPDEMIVKGMHFLKMEQIILFSHCQVI